MCSRHAPPLRSTSVVPPDLAGYERFSMDHLTRLSGISDTVSGFALKAATYSTALPLGPGT